MHVCIYIQNNYTRHTQIFYVNRLLFWMRLIAINFCTALIKIENILHFAVLTAYINIHNIFDQINVA